MIADTISFAKDATLSPDSFMTDPTNDDSCSVVSSTGPIDENFQCWKKSMIIKPKQTTGLNIFIVKRIDDDESTSLSLEMMKVLSSFKTKIFVEEVCLDELKSKDTNKLDFYGLSDGEEVNIDLAIVIGGDGSILWTLKHFQDAKNTPPILAFSKGTLNYLCNFKTTDFENTLKKIMEAVSSGKPIQIEHRFRLQCEIINKETGKTMTLHALNEIVIDRGMNPTIVKLDCHLEDKYFATFEGDGVMVATPTGSTAYQLSAGGPIMNHLNSSMAVTPIAPMNLSTRPVVLPSGINLSFKLKEESRKSAFLSADGQTRVEITKGTEVRITGSPYPVPFILDEDKDTLDNWIFRLRDLLGWNRKI